MIFSPSAKSRALRFLVGASLLVALPVASCAGVGDGSRGYSLEVLDQPVAVGAHTKLTVKLTDASTGQLVQGATITGADLEMRHVRPAHKVTPSEITTTTMSGDVKFLGPSGPGLYELMADISMPGKWKLKLSANIPGETKPVVNTVKFQAGR